MPQTYTVKSGDTLSKIAKTLGTSVSNLTGYRSGDPNVIYPGEIINIKTAPASPPPAPKPSPFAPFAPLVKPFAPIVNPFISKPAPAPVKSPASAPTSAPTSAPVKPTPPAKPTPTSAPVPSKPTSTIPTLESIQKGIADIQKRIETEGVTGKGGEVLLPPKGTPTPEMQQADRKAEIDKLNQEGNATQNDELKIIEDKAGEKVDLSKSSGLVTKLTELLETYTAKQKEGPSLEQKFIDERKKLGVAELETSLAEKDAALKKLDAEFASTVEEEEGRPVSMLQIRRRQGAAETAYNRLRRDLVVERESIANQLNQKYGVLNSMVKFAGMDYDNAQQNYQFQWNAAIQLGNLVKGIEESQKTDAERKQDNARANAQIMFNLFKEGNVTYDTLDESTKLDIKNTEIQAGFPIGFTKFIMDTIEDPVINFGSQFTDESGNLIQPVITVNKKTGNLSVKNVNLGKGTKGTDKQTEQETIRDARSGIVAYFNQKKGGDGFVSPDTFKAAKTAWMADGFSGEDFDKAFKSFANPQHYEDYSDSYF